MNNLSITGNVCNDIVVKKVSTKNGEMAVANLNIAVNRFVNGEQKTDFFRATAWGTSAENCAAYLKKGSHVGVTGSVTCEVYTGNDGKPRASLVIENARVEFGPRTAGAAPKNDAEVSVPTNKNDSVAVDDEDDVLPF